MCFFDCCEEMEERVSKELQKKKKKLRHHTVGSIRTC
jgi:hypothetical protein